MSNPTTNSVADTSSDSSDDDPIEYEIEVVTSSSSLSSASSTSDRLEANELADSAEEANTKPNTGEEENNGSTASRAELIINPSEDRGDVERSYEVHNADTAETTIQQEVSVEPTSSNATAATTTVISETSNIDHDDSADAERLDESTESYVEAQTGEIEANLMGGSQVAQQQAIDSNDSDNGKGADESLHVNESNKVGAKTSEPQDVSYCAIDGESKSCAIDENNYYPQLISSADNESKQQIEDSKGTSDEERDQVIETVPSSATTQQPLQMMPPDTGAPASVILMSNQIDQPTESKPMPEDESQSSEGPSNEVNADEALNDGLVDESGSNNNGSNDLKTTTQQVVSNDSVQPTEDKQHHGSVSESIVDSEPQNARRQSADLSDSRDDLVPIKDGDLCEEQPDSDSNRPIDDATVAKENESSPGPVSVGISVEPPPQPTSGTTRLSLAMSPDTVFRRESFSEDLEREFDEEPEFEPRVVTLKRDQDARLEYELADELGRGRFGTVYHCRENATGRSLAAKFINIRRQEDREDVEREIGIMSKLQHKRLLQLYDAFDNRAQNEMCLITELIEGGELFERIVDDDFDLTEKKAAVFMRQICEGVEYMHSQQIVHLDMKPENILCLSKTGNRIKLIDFGLARQLDPNRPLHVMFGTPDFAAPEVLSYEAVTFATDMWSIGVICYVLLSGLLPFMGDTDMQTMANVTKAEFEFDEQAFEPISDLAKDFISKLLIKDPNKRLKPRECLQHAWLQRGGAQLEAAVIERRKSSIASLSFLLSGAQQARLEQLALLASSPKSGTGSTDSSRTPTGPRGSISIPVQQVDPAVWGEQLSTCSTADAIIPALFSLSKRNLKRYVIRRKWHKTVHAIMALGRMGATLRSKLVP